MDNSEKAAFIIPVFNKYSFTEKCLLNLQPFNSKFDIIVVDDGSSDETSTRISADFPWVHLLKGNGNLWWSGSINKGMEYAFRQLYSTYVIWWNNDIICASDYMEQVELLTKLYGPNTVLGSKIYISGKENIIWSMGGFFNRINGDKDMYGLNQPDSEEYGKPFNADWLPGMGTIISREIFNKTGLLNETDFPQYHGDSDYTLRALNAGFNIVVHPNLKIWNDKSSSGLMHNGQWSKLYESLISIRSNYNVKKELKFYKLHAQSIKAYHALLLKYSKYIGGFLKWKLLGLFKIRKQH